MQDDQIVSPAWVDSERYDIAAKVPPGTTLAEQRMMLRNLLTERFHMSVRLEAREMPGYVLTVANGGPKFKESVVDPAVKPLKGADCRTTPDKDAVPQMPAGCRQLFLVRPRDSGKSYIVARQGSISGLINALRVPLSVGRERIVDKTGLTGSYDYRLGYSEAGLSATASADALPVESSSPSKSAKSTNATIIAVRSDPSYFEAWNGCSKYGSGRTPNRRLASLPISPGAVTVRSSSRLFPRCESEPSAHA